MRTIWAGLAASCAVAITACSSNPSAEQTAAKVEDRQPVTQAQAVPQAPVAAVDLTSVRPASASSALKDPNNILSKRSVFFEYDSFVIRDEFKPLVEAHARYLRDNGSARMLIQGNTDERGSREYNLALGQKRADALKKMLLLLGAREEQIESVSLGEEKPRAQGGDAAAHAQNRRDDILYAGEY